jgi:hypothetical protein
MTPMPMMNVLGYNTPALVQNPLPVLPGHQHCPGHLESSDTHPSLSGSHEAWGGVMAIIVAPIATAMTVARNIRNRVNVCKGTCQHWLLSNCVSQNGIGYSVTVLYGMTKSFHCSENACIFIKGGISAWVQ